MLRVEKEYWGKRVRHAAIAYGCTRAAVLSWMRYCRDELVAYALNAAGFKRPRGGRWRERDVRILRKYGTLAH